MKKIIVLGVNAYLKKTIEKLKAAGYYVIVTDKNPEADGSELANEFYSIDIMDQEETLGLSRNKNIDGIIALNEFGSGTAAYVADKMNLNGYKISTIEATKDKGLMRDCWFKAGLNIPGYTVIQTLDQAVKAAKQIGYPCILKPADSGGSGRGVSIINSPDDVRWAYEFARPYASKDRFIIEAFIDGTELTIESFTINNKTTFLAISDKVKPDLRTRVATSINYPANLPQTILHQVKNQVEEALEALQLDNGIAHTEIIVNKEGKPFLIETAARGGGGHIFHTIIEVVSGVNVPVLQAKWLLKEPLEIGEITHKGCCYRFFDPPRGILKEVHQIELAKKIPGVLDIGITRKPGEAVGGMENSLQRSGFIVTTGKNREDAIAIADQAEDMVKFIVE